MKKNIFLYSLILLSGIIACDSSMKKESTGTVTIDSGTINEEKPPFTPPYDPDPTDTVPGDQYNVSSSSKETAALVRLTLQNLHKEDLKKDQIDSFGRKYIFYEFDLNDDGNKEIFVGLRGSYFCGSGGCTTYLLDNQGNVITKFSVSRDIVIDNKKTNGFKDLFIYSGGKFRIVKFNGKSYPSNPSTLPALNVVPGDDLPRALNFVNEPYPSFTF